MYFASAIFCFVYFINKDSIINVWVRKIEHMKVQM